MSTTAYKQVDLAYNDNIDIKPPVVAARIKQVYEKTLIGRALMPTEQVQSDAVAYLEEQDVTGNVSWLQEQGGFPSLDFDHRKKSKAIRPYGAYFDVSMMERRFGLVNTIGRKIERAAYRMRAFEDNLIFKSIMETTGVNEIPDATNWNVATGAGMGDPISDLEQAKRLIRDTTYLEATDVIMSSMTFERMTKFDLIRNKLYNSTSYVESGVVPSLVGLNILIDNAVDKNDDGKMVVLRRNSFGYLAEAIPLTTVAVPGANTGNIMIDNRYYNMCMAEPIVDAPEFVCVVSGLKG
jgi:hypothetical protein